MDNFLFRAGAAVAVNWNDFLDPRLSPFAYRFFGLRDYAVFWQPDVTHKTFD